MKSAAPLTARLDAFRQACRLRALPAPASSDNCGWALRDACGRLTHFRYLRAEAEAVARAVFGEDLSAMGVELVAVELVAAGTKKAAPARCEGGDATACRPRPGPRARERRR